jgi:hypothetical protein
MELKLHYRLQALSICRRSDTKYVTHICLIAGPSGRSPPEIVGSNPTGAMDVYLLLSVVCCQVEVSATN